MDGADERIGGGDDHCAGSNRLVIHSVVPILPETGNRQHRAVPRCDVVGLLAISRGLPFKVTRSRNQTTVPLESVPEHRLFGYGFGSGIERRGEGFEGLFPPPRDQLPPHRHKE